MRPSNTHLAASFLWKGREGHQRGLLRLMDLANGIRTMVVTRSAVPTAKRDGIVRKLCMDSDKLICRPAPNTFE